MVFNTKGVEANKIEMVTKAGNYLFKIVDIIEDGYDANGNPKAKVKFEGKEIVDGKLKDEIQVMFEWYEATEKMAWKLAILRDALKSPEVFDMNDWLNRYVVAVVEMNTYNGKTNPRFKKLQYSKLNDNLPPIPEAKQGNNEPEVVVEMPDLGLLDDEIPF